jgi:hypothetical protein
VAVEVERPRVAKLKGEDMVVELEVGTKLVAHYKGAEYRAVVVEEESEPKLKVTDNGGSARVEAGKVFGSLSGAGRALTGAKAVGGRKFWTVLDRQAPAVKRPVARKRLEVEAPPRPAPAPRPAPTPAPGPRRFRQIKRFGETGRYWCSACQSSFTSAIAPDGCPAGHPVFIDL